MSTDLPEFDLYWFGEPSCYDPKDPALKPFPEGDLGGRYFGLPIGRRPQELFDDTTKLLKALYQSAYNRSMTSGRPVPEKVLIDGIRMTWVFSSREINRLKGENEVLEARVTKLESLLASSDQPS